MPKIVVSNINVNKPTETTLIQPILGLCSSIGSNKQCIFVKDVIDLYSKIGSKGLDKEQLLLSSGYSLKIAPRRICEPNYKIIRILENGSYCYPDPSSEPANETKANYNFEYLMEGDQTLSVKFPLVDFQDGNYILLNTGQFYALIYWGDALDVNPLLAEVIYKVTSTESLKEFLTLRCGFNVVEYTDYLLLSKGTPFGTSYFTNIRDFEITPDLNGISDIMNRYVKSTIEIRTKESRYQDDIHIHITKNISSAYVIQVIVSNQVLEQYTFDFTRASLNNINESSKIIVMRMFSKGNISGDYVLKRDFKGVCYDNTITQSLFEDFPYVTALITKGFALQTHEGATRLPYIYKDNLIAFDSNEQVDWQNGVAKHKGSCVYQKATIDSEIYFLLRLREGGVLGESTEISSVDKPTDEDYNGLSEEYSYELLRWIYRDNGEFQSVIPTLTLRIIDTAFQNNLRNVQEVTPSILNNISSKYMSWLTSFNDLEVVSIERSGEVQTVTLQITVDGFDGTSKTVNLSITI